MKNILHIDTDELGIQVDRDDKGGLRIDVDSRETWITHLEADGEKSIRIGDLFIAARELIGDSDNHEYARGMAELIGNFAPKGTQFDSDHMRAALSNEDAVARMAREFASRYEDDYVKGDPAARAAFIADAEALFGKSSRA